MVAELNKPIKPKRLNVAKVRQNLLKALEKEGDAIAKEFKKTVSSWQGERPKFEILVAVDNPPGAATLLVGPTGTENAVNKWVWNDEGTKPHVIRARNVPRLIFKTGYSAKTKPGFFGSFPGGSFGPTVSKFQVNHPGTKARGWSVLIVKRRRKKFIQAMNKAAKVVIV